MKNNKKIRLYSFVVFIFIISLFLLITVKYANSKKSNDSLLAKKLELQNSISIVEKQLSDLKTTTDFINGVDNEITKLLFDFVNNKAEPMLIQTSNIEIKNDHLINYKSELSNSNYRLFKPPKGNFFHMLKDFSFKNKRFKIVYEIILENNLPNSNDNLEFMADIVVENIKEHHWRLDAMYYTN